MMLSPDGVIARVQAIWARRWATFTREEYSPISRVPRGSRIAEPSWL